VKRAETAGDALSLRLAITARADRGYPRAMSPPPPNRKQTGFLLMLAFVLVAAASAAVCVAPLASAEDGVLVRFVKAGPGPTQTVLEVNVGGASNETTDLGPSTHPSRHFQLGRSMLATLEEKLLAADFPRLNARYGLPNPGGVFTVTTIGARTATVYAPASGPAGLGRLNRYLELILTEH